MIQSRIFAPPSPPSSPRMSGQDYKPGVPSWQDQQEQNSSFGSSYPEGGHYQASNATVQSDQRFNNQSASSLRSYRTSPYPLNNQYHSHGLTGQSYTLPPQQNADMPGVAQPDPSQQSGAVPAHQQGFHPSATGSPLSKSSPRSDGLDEQEEDAEEDDPDAAGEPEDEEGKPAMTAAELRNQKRKMKRFRCISRGSLRCGHFY